MGSLKLGAYESTFLFQAMSRSYETIFDDVPEGEEGEANEETQGATYQRV